MIRIISLFVLCCCFYASTWRGYAGETQVPPEGAAKAPPTDWIDPATGHRVIRLSPDGGGSSLYFHQNTYTPEGDKLIFNTKGGIAVVDLATLGVKPPMVEIAVQGAAAIAMAWKTREVYFVKGGKGGSVYAANVDTRAVREIKHARGGTINADETFARGRLAPPTQREKRFSPSRAASAAAGTNVRRQAPEEDPAHGGGGGIGGQGGKTCRPSRQAHLPAPFSSPISKPARR